MLGLQSAEMVPRGVHTILIVDDDQAILSLLRQKLELAGFHVEAATSGEDALGLIERRGLPHLAIIDIKMPGMDGLALAGALQRFADLPIIMCTAVSEEATIVRSIEQYAEDYVTKPFSPNEVVARVRRVLRRFGDYGYTFDPLTCIDDHLAVDLAHQRALVAGNDVALTPTETKLLYILMRNAPRPVTVDFLVRRLWPHGEVFEDALRVHIRRLRAKLEPHPNRPHYILTERGVGYRFPAPAEAGRSTEAECPSPQQEE